MTTINIDADVLRRVLAGDDTARQEARKLLGTKKPTTRLMGRWAKHSEYEDVLITSEKVGPYKRVVIVYPNGEYSDGAAEATVPFDDLVFPYQATRPEDVPIGEAWLVDVENKRVAALKSDDDQWSTGVETIGTIRWWMDEEVTLVAPLVPSRPGHLLGGESS